jgi:hypothetical protein
MIPGVIEGHTRAPGAPQDWDAEKSGPCVALPIRDAVGEDGVHRMESIWETHPAELQALLEGGKVLLSICGAGPETRHPVVSLEVTPPFDGWRPPAPGSDQLTQLVRMLGKLYKPAEVMAWLVSPHSKLPAPPIAMIAQERLETVLGVVREMVEGQPNGQLWTPGPERKGR